MKMIYVLRGSEDGNLGVYTSKRKLMEAVKRLQADGMYINSEALYFSGHYTMIECDGGANLTMEAFVLNR